MTIATYAELKTAVANWLGRDDVADARISEFVTMFEAVANRVLRVRQQETSTTLTPTAGVATLPTDYLNWRKVVWAGSTDRALEYVVPEFFTAAYPLGAAQSPNIFTIEGLTLKVNSSSDEGLTFHYYQKIPALSDDAPTNWLLLAYPDLYLFGSLVESEMFLVNDERALSWKSRRDELLEEVRQLSNRSRGAGRVRLVQATP